MAISGRRRELTTRVARYPALNKASGIRIGFIASNSTTPRKTAKPVLSTNPAKAVRVDRLDASALRPNPSIHTEIGGIDETAPYPLEKFHGTEGIERSPHRSATGRLSGSAYVPI
jgi:hypothetical protein